MITSMQMWLGIGYCAHMGLTMMILDKECIICHPYDIVIVVVRE